MFDSADEHSKNLFALSTWKNSLIFRRRKWKIYNILYLALSCRLFDGVALVFQKSI